MRSASGSASRRSVGDARTALYRQAVGTVGNAGFGANHGGKLALQTGGDRLVGHLVLEVGTCFSGLAGLVVLGCLFASLVASQLGERSFDPTPFACHQRSRTLLIHDVLSLRDPEF